MRFAMAWQRRPALEALKRAREVDPGSHAWWCAGSMARWSTESLLGSCGLVLKVPGPTGIWRCG